MTDKDLTVLRVIVYVGAVFWMLAGQLAFFKVLDWMMLP